MIKKITILIIAVDIVFGIDLRMLIKSLDSSELIKSYRYQIKSLESQNSSVNLKYFPKIELGVSSRITKLIEPDNAFSLEPTQIAPNISAKASWVVFDGFYKFYKSKEILAKKESMIYDKYGLKADLSLKLTKLYFTIQNLKEDLKSLKQQKKLLAAQENRLNKFYQNGLVTIDEVEQIKAISLSNQINIDNINYTIDKLMLNMHLITNQKFDRLDNVKFLEPTNKNYLQSKEILSLMAKIKGLKAKKRQIYSDNFPKIIVADEYIYTYYPKDYKYPSMNLGMAGAMELKSPQQQNKITIALSMNLTDFGSTTMSIDSINQQILALNEQLEYKKRDKIAKFQLSKKYIKIAKANINTAKQSMIANQKIFNTISKKYEKRVVDNVVYLDALSRFIKAKASYQKAKNAYEIELATYYYNQGEDISKYIVKE